VAACGAGHKSSLRTRWNALGPLYRGDNQRETGTSPRDARTRWLERAQGSNHVDLYDGVCQPRITRMTRSQDSLMALRAETLRDPAGQRDREDARHARGCWCFWLAVPVVLAVVWALPGVWGSHLRPWHNAFTSALTDPYTLGGVAVTFTLALYGLLQCIDLDGK